MKAGANYKDRNAIKACAAKGMSAQEISDHLLIDLNCVKSFMFYGDEANLDSDSDSNSDEDDEDEDHQE